MTRIKRHSVCPMFQVIKYKRGKTMSEKLVPLVEFVEDYRDRFEILVEEIEGKKKKYLEGTWAQSEIWNANSRWYQKAELVKEVNRFNTDIIPNRKALGELDHSQETQVLLHRASHIFESELSMDGNDLVGRAKVMDTSFGQTLSVLIDEKVPFGVSSKGMGSLSKIKKEGRTGNLVSGFQMRSPGDVVYNQSAPNAIPKVVLEMIAEHDRRLEEIWGIEVLDPIRKRIKEINAKQIGAESEKIWHSLRNK